MMRAHSGPHSGGPDSALAASSTLAQGCFLSSASSRARSGSARNAKWEILSVGHSNSTDTESSIRFSRSRLLGTVVIRRHRARSELRCHFPADTAANSIPVGDPYRSLDDARPRQNDRILLPLDRIHVGRTFARRFPPDFAPVFGILSSSFYTP